MDLRTSIEEAKARLLSELKSASSKDLLAQVRNRYLTGKESVLRGLFSLLSKVPADKKGEEGKTLNAFKGWVESEIDRVQAELGTGAARSEEHTSELQSQSNLVCRLLLEKKKKTKKKKQ